MSACSAWRVPTASKDLFEPATADAPVLMVSGSMDHVTPPEWSRRVCRQLRHCRLVVIPDLGHAPFDLGAWKGADCFDRLALDLYRTGNLETLDATCVEAMEPPGFLVE